MNSNAEKSKDFKKVLILVALALLLVLLLFLVIFQVSSINKSSRKIDESLQLQAKSLGDISNLQSSVIGIYDSLYFFDEKMQVIKNDIFSDRLKTDSVFNFLIRRIDALQGALIKQEKINKILYEKVMIPAPEKSAPLKTNPPLLKDSVTRSPSNSIDSSPHSIIPKPVVVGVIEDSINTTNGNTSKRKRNRILFK